MATVINRNTCRVIQSANTPNYPVEDWIIEPNLSSVTGVPKKYWKTSGDSVLEMSQAEKNTVDNANIESLKNSQIAAAFLAKELRAMISIMAEEFSMTELTLYNTLMQRLIIFEVISNGGITMTGDADVT